jgi:hypothetical protein
MGIGQTKLSGLELERDAVSFTRLKAFSAAIKIPVPVLLILSRDQVCGVYSYVKSEVSGDAVYLSKALCGLVYKVEDTHHTSTEVRVTVYLTRADYEFVNNIRGV